MYPPSAKFSVENSPAWAKAAMAARSRVDVKRISKIGGGEQSMD